MERSELLRDLNLIISDLDFKKKKKLSAELSKQTYFEDLSKISISMENEVWTNIEKRTKAQKEFEIKFKKFNNPDYKLKLGDIQTIDYQIKLLDIEIETLELRYKAYKISYGSDLL